MIVSMVRFLSRWLDIYEEEIGLFLWSTAILFLIRSSNILFNNFAETAFLKRYGVEFLPIVYMVNSVSTFFIMAALAGLMGRLPGNRLLSYLLVFCGASVAALRFVVPFGFDLLYPVLFVLKSQYEVLLGLVFWNLANDLFNTRQSKRLFPLITAGGVFGGILGSFGTPFLVKTIALDNLMFAYLVTTTVGAVTVARMGSRYPALLVSEKRVPGSRKKIQALEEFKKIWPLLKESKLVKILIVLTLMPNVVIPILNYQFNFAVDQTFASETSMIKFFGYFKGALNIISLVILLFVGKLYSRWGLPVALMFHPINYLVAFVAFLLQFNVFSAIYARISTNVLRTTINNPARAVLVGLVPAAVRAVVRPFLRGTVVRIGILLGSGFILASERMVHPRYLSVIAAVFVGAWIVSTFLLKRSYSGILLDLVSSNTLDIRSMEESDLSHVFADKQVRAQLIQALASSRGRDAFWYARLLKSLGVADLDEHILSMIKDQDERTRIELLSMLSPEAGSEALKKIRDLADHERPELMGALCRAASRIDSEDSWKFCQEVYEQAHNPEVKALAVAGLYKRDRETYRGTIEEWLDSGGAAEKRAGIIAARESGDPTYIPKIKAVLDGNPPPDVLSPALLALSRLGAEEVNDLVAPHLSHEAEEVRLAALEAFVVRDDDSLGKVIDLLGDPSERIHEFAREKIQNAPYVNAQLLVESLVARRRRIRDGLFDVLETLNIKDLDVFRFVRAQMERSYRNLSEAVALKHVPDCDERNLLIDHLRQSKQTRLENVLRVLAIQDRTGQMRIVWRGLASADPRQRSNSVEALDDLLDPSLTRIMLPLLEAIPDDQCLRIGSRHFDLPRFNSDLGAIYRHLLDKKDWLQRLLTLNLIRRQGLDGLEEARILELAESENAHIRRMARSVARRHGSGSSIKEDRMTTEISIPDRILHLRGIQVFEGLSVSELAAVASVTEEEVYPAGKEVIREGDPGDTMYLIIQGKVSVIKGQGDPDETELGQIGSGDYFGEMALFEDDVRSATIRTIEETRLLVLHKREFTEIVREYPQIALHICKVLSQRIRKLHEKVKS